MIQKYNGQGTVSIGKKAIFCNMTADISVGDSPTGNLTCMKGGDWRRVLLKEGTFRLQLLGVLVVQVPFQNDRTRIVQR